MFNLKH